MNIYLGDGDNEVNEQTEDEVDTAIADGNV